MPHASNDAISMTSSQDIGAVVDAILRGGSKYHNQSVALVAERLTEEKKLDIWSKGTPNSGTGRGPSSNYE